MITSSESEKKILVNQKLCFFNICQPPKILRLFEKRNILMGSDFFLSTNKNRNIHEWNCDVEKRKATTS